MQLQNKVLLLLIKAQSEQYGKKIIEVNAASFDKIAKLLDFLYLYLTSGKSSRRKKREVAGGAPAVAGLF